MSAHNGFVVEVKELRKHSNADRLQIATFFTEDVCVGLDVNLGDKGVYFPCDLQLDLEFCLNNNLLRDLPDGTKGPGYMDLDKRNVKAIRLRGEKSSGVYLPISCLAYTGVDLNSFKPGDTIAVVNGKEICRKYIPKCNHYNNHSGNKNIKKAIKNNKNNIIFPQHIDSPQLKYYIDSFKDGDLITITEKLEGTSHRSALLPVKKINWIRRLFGLSEKIEYKDFCGSRRVIINNNNINDGFYGDNEFRMDIHRRLVPHLTPNLEVFGEIVGWPNEYSPPLMGEVSTKPINDKNFTKKYGEKMVFHYGCKTGTYDFYIYRICELNDDGSVKIEFSTDQIILWCEQHGFKYVPILYRGFLNKGSDIINLGEKYADGESTLARHWREGCVIRIDNHAHKFDVYKNKNFYYKVMKGMFVENVNPDDFGQDILEEL